MDLPEEIQPAAGLVVVAHIVGKRVRCIAPVNAPAQVVKAADLLVADCPQGNIVKHFAAGAGDFTQVFMAVGLRLYGLEVLRLHNELLSQPFRRNSQIGGVMHQGVLPFDGHILVDPVPGRPGRVKGVECKKISAATQH